MNGPVLDDLVTCADCGHELKPTALFCTSCGTKRIAESTVSASSLCSACGSELKPGAGFCTECGLVIPKVDEPPAVGAEKGDVPVHGRADGISPAASRAILESVGGGRGGYVGPRGVQSRSSSDVSRTPPGVADGVRAPEHPDSPGRRTGVIVGAVAAVLVLVGLGVFFAVRPKGDNSTATQPSVSSASTMASATTLASATTNTPATTADDKAAAAKKAEAERKAAAEKKAAEERKAAEAAKAAEERAKAEAAQRAAQTAPPQQQPVVPVEPGQRAPNTLAPQGPAPSGRLVVASVNAPASGPVTLVLRNDGNATLSWRVTRAVWGTTFAQGAFPSGSIGPGGVATVHLSWPGSSNPTGVGWIDISSPDGGSKSVQISR